jgi:dihydroflavonol-4-reductase
MRVFVTGATGFIGRQLIARLTQTQHEVCCLVRPTSNVSILAQHGVELIQGDVTDTSSVLAGMRGCDWVFNLANVYSFWEPHKRVYREVNVEGTRIVLESALETGVSKVVHVSSVVCYGRPTDCPFTEESTPGPVRFSEYARTKYEGDLIAWELHETKGLPLVTVYPGAVLGPGDPKATGQYIRNLMMRRMPATVHPDSVMTLVHVRDAAQTILAAAEKEGNIGQRYLVGSSRMSFRELNRMIRGIAGTGLPKLTLPGPVAGLTAALLTGLANLTKRPPAWGMSTDMVRTMKEGFQFDGSKAERELGITYTPIRVAVEEAITSFRNEPGQPSR